MKKRAATKTVTMILLLALCACGDEGGGLHAPRPAVLASASSGVGGGGQGGDGGGGEGVGGAPVCDPWDKSEGAPACCAPHPKCYEGVLGACLVDVQLCNGACEGTHVNPVPSAPCEGGGTCDDEGACVPPESPMVGGAGGVGGDGDGDDT